MTDFIDFISDAAPEYRETLEPMRVFIHDKHLKKNELLFRAGMVFRDMYYLKSGACYMYSIEGGKEVVTEFFFEGEMMCDHFSFLTGRPSNQFVRILEDTRLESLAYDDIQRLYNEIPWLDRIGRILMERITVRLLANLVTYKKDSGEVRYRRLLRLRPQLFQRVPQYLIASYLGITPVGLSQIRKRLFRS